jgi:hypothetical protein
MGHQGRDVHFLWNVRRHFRWVLPGVVLGLLSPTLVSSNALNWTQQLGSNREDFTLGIAVDRNNDVYTTGRTNGNLGGTPFGDFDAWLAKYASAGALLWKRQLGTSRDDTANAIATNLTEEIVIAGNTEGVLEGSNKGSSDIWLAKYDKQGNALWKRQFGTQDTDSALGVAIDRSNFIYLTGFTEGRLNLRGASKPPDAWLAKLDNNGNTLWIKQFGSGGDDYAAAVGVDIAGNIYLCGATSGSIAGDFGGFDAWVAKFSPSGGLEWKRQLGTTADDRALALNISDAGEVLLTGVTGGNLGGTYAGETDAWIAKYNSAGRMVWKKQLGTSAADSGTGIARDASGAVYVTGQTSGAIGGANKGEVDGWLVKYSPRGGLVWKRQIGTSGEDTSNGIAVDAQNSIYIGGETQGRLANPSAGLFDTWVAKYLP